VASLCNRSTDAVFRFVEWNSGFAGSKTKSEGINAGAKTEEMYATSTSGIGPTGPASTSRGRSFMPAISPTQNLLSQSLAVHAERLGEMIGTALDAVEAAMRSRKLVVRRGAVDRCGADHRVRLKAVDAFVEILELFDACKDPLSIGSFAD